MPRYIDADKLKTRIAPKSLFRDTLVEWIDLQETEDVAPVVHAHWIDTLYGWACSNCEEEQEYTLYLGHCPYCGAKMDEEVDDEKVYHRSNR